MRRAALIGLVLLLLPIKAAAYEEPEQPYEETMYRMKVTCYYAAEDAVTCTGAKPYRGIVATSKDPEIWGRTILIYERLEGDRLGELLYIGESRDTGNSKTINTKSVKDEAVIDVLITDNSQLISGDVWVQVITAAG